ncbi:ROK family transcriptional regulator [Actinokineospora sp. PR83]|uniref:ROK family transcriptional regulator n=1 Tax=Actinokineospora sp. PR83 TaxID=2884908 RepID=UPI0027DF13F2|nr:ROK family transcriptional regulator [Actinokineospora sp. PR83]MCG8919706.1 ROK family transcriptional regulator [Actinokineospora sp. PR83]
MRPAGQLDVRRHNSALLLAAVTANPGCSRAGLAATTGLAKATVSSLVDHLVAGGLVAETGPVERTGRGRTGTGLALSATGPHGVGVAVGVDHVTACLVDPLGGVRARRVRSGDNRGRAPEDVLAAVTRVVRSLAEQGVPVGGVGVAVPGLVRDGVLLSAPNLDWSEVDIALDVGVPVTVVNEANAAALAELRPGGPRDYVLVSGEVGVGAGIVRDGALLTGVHGFAGELGHLCVDPSGPRCGCGARGCLETYAGTAALPTRQAAADGDPEALSALESAGTRLGQALSGVVNLLDIPTIVLGGDHARLAPWLLGPLRAELARRVIGARWSPPEVVASTLGREAAALGVARAAVDHIRADPDSYLRGLGQAL